MTRDHWLVAGILAIVLGGSLFIIGTLVLTQQHAARDRAVAAEATRSAAAARLALDQANHDRAFLFAVCQALNQRDKISAWTSKAIEENEIRYHPVQPSEAAYHKARERILARAMNARAAIASFDCVKGMVTAVKEAPTDAPTLEASATP